MCETLPQDVTCRGPCFRDSTANILQRQISRVPLRRTSENVIMVFQSCLTARAEPGRGVVGLRKLEFLGVGGLPIMDELEPLEKTGPFNYFQMAFMAIPVNPCPR